MKARVAVETLNGKWADIAAFYASQVSVVMEHAVEFASALTAHEIPVRIIVEPDYEEGIDEEA